MKYNRQQKFNLCSAVKTLVLLSLLCVSAFLGYSCLKLRQRHQALLNSIESHKTQISDIEALSRANKEVLKSLRSNVELHRSSLNKMMGQIGSQQSGLQAETLFVSLQKRLKELGDQNEHDKAQAQEQLDNDLRNNEKMQQNRSAKIAELTSESNRLIDEIGAFKKLSIGGPGVVNINAVSNRQAEHEQQQQVMRAEPVKVATPASGHSNSSTGSVRSSTVTSAAQRRSSDKNSVPDKKNDGGVAGADTKDSDNDNDEVDTEQHQKPVVPAPSDRRQRLPDNRVEDDKVKRNPLKSANEAGGNGAAGRVR